MSANWKGKNLSVSQKKKIKASSRKRNQKIPALSLEEILAEEIKRKLPHLPPLSREIRFHPTRRWRLDLGWNGRQLGIEIHGGEWAQGRHIRPAGFINDREKMNEAIRCGWQVLEFTGTHLSKRLDWVIEIIGEVYDESSR